jgi:dipeptidase E
MGETRETRIKEFHTQNNIPVVGLREGSWIRVKGDVITMEGSQPARIFTAGNDPYELAAGSMLDKL